MKTTAQPGPDECRAMNRLCLSAALRKTERLVTRHYDRYLAKAGVTAVQLPILAFIAAADEPTLRKVTEQFELDRSTLSRNLSVLQRDGLVVLGPSSGPKPGRLSLTRKGKSTLGRAWIQWQAAHEALTAASGEKLSADATAFLRGLRQGVRKMENKKGRV